MDKRKKGGSTKLEEKIRCFAWDCTVGAGLLEGEDPGEDELQELAQILGRPLTTDDVDMFEKAWRRCLQEAAQP